MIFVGSVLAASTNLGNLGTYCIMSSVKKEGKKNSSNLCLNPKQNMLMLCILCIVDSRDAPVSIVLTKYKYDYLHEFMRTCLYCVLILVLSSISAIKYSDFRDIFYSHVIFFLWGCWWHSEKCTGWLLWLRKCSIISASLFETQFRL